ncbi:thermonuclease family protein [Candidatus Woesearchaeota archaeon]|nr:thermonuclease family protein [Candidatus Woesearchaeota archaeon]
MKAILIVIALLLTSCAAPEKSPDAVVNVIDGDTFETESGEIVRLLCIDAPEKRSQFYLDAKARLLDLVDGKEIILRKGSEDNDKYGRSLRYVYADGVFVNEQLVREGLARAYVYNQSEECAWMLSVEFSAKSQGLGIWSGVDVPEEEPAQTPAEEPAELPGIVVDEPEELEVSPRPVLFGTYCDVDYTEAPEMANYSETVLQLCDDNLPDIEEELGSYDTERILLVFREQSSPGERTSSAIYLSKEWFTENPDDLGAIIHEMAHAVQDYPAYDPWWLVEGIADHVRYALGYQNSWSYPHCCAESPHYTSGYWCTAAFLQYVQREYDDAIIKELDYALKEDSYDASLFKAWTGKTIEELWEECKMSDCAGGSP